AEAVAEIDEAILAGEIRIADGLAILVGQREGPADPRALERRLGGRAFARAIASCERGAESEDQACTDQPLSHICDIHHAASLGRLAAENQPLSSRGATDKLPQGVARSCFDARNSASPLVSSCCSRSRGSSTPRRRSSAAAMPFCKRSRAATGPRRPRR